LVNAGLAELNIVRDIYPARTSREGKGLDIPWLISRQEAGFRAPVILCQGELVPTLDQSKKAKHALRRTSLDSGRDRGEFFGRSIGALWPHGLQKKLAPGGGN